MKLNKLWVVLRAYARRRRLLLVVYGLVLAAIYAAVGHAFGHRIIAGACMAAVLAVALKFEASKLIYVWRRTKRPGR